MLLSKTTSSRSVRSETVRKARRRVRRVPRQLGKAASTTKRDLAKCARGRASGTPRDEQEQYIYKRVLMILLVLVLPAILMLLYLFFNPEAFQYDITPKHDFSQWDVGKPL